jgi:hypothetical protein
MQQLTISRLIDKQKRTVYYMLAVLLNEHFVVLSSQQDYGYLVCYESEIPFLGEADLF